MKSHTASVTLQGITKRIHVTAREKTIIEFLLGKDPGQWVRKSDVQSSLNFNYVYLSSCIRRLNTRLNIGEPRLFGRKREDNHTMIRILFSKEHIRWLD